MKLQELLNPLLVALRNASQQLQFFKAHHHQQPADKVLAASLVEFDYLIHHLNLLISKTDLNQEASPLNLKPFQEVLANRWALIRHTPLAYTESHKERSTVLSVLLAKALAPVLGKSYYQLLMPTLEVLEDSLGNHIDELQLFEFKLSDDQKRFIHVGFCLELAEQDGVLKHTTHFEGEHYVGFYRNVKPLSEEECRRITEYSPLTLSYWRAIKRIASVKHEGMSFGAFVQRLVNSLVKGGKAARGGLTKFEYNSGAAANIGMVEFSSFLDALTVDERKLLGTKNKVLNSFVPAFDDEISIQSCLDLLFNPAEIKVIEEQDKLKSTYQNYNAHNLGIRHCVETIAGKLQTILNDNPQLFASKLANHAAAVDVLFSQELNDMLVKERKAFNERNGPRYVIQVDQTRPEQVPNLLKVIFNLAVHTLNDCYHYASKFPTIPRLEMVMHLNGQNINSLLPDGRALANLLAWLPPHDHDKFLKTKLVKDFILHLIPNYHSLMSLQLPARHFHVLQDILKFQPPRQAMDWTPSAAPRTLFSKEQKVRRSSVMKEEQPTKLRRRH